MSQQRLHRGKLFHNADKRKPSQPDMQGDARLAGKPYAISAWKRDDELALSLAPPREDSNKYPPEAFRGSLAPVRRRANDDGPVPVWEGDIDGDELAFSVRAFEQQGKSGVYLRLEIEPAAPSSDPS